MTTTIEAVDLGAFLLTYLIHSTLLLSGVWVATRLWSSAVPADREVLWKLALAGGLATSVLQSCVWLPHWGTIFSLAGSAPDRSGTSMTAAHSMPALEAIPATEAIAAAVSAAAADTFKASGSATWTMAEGTAWNWAIGLWLVGVGGCFLRTAFRCVSLARYHQNTKPARSQALLKLVGRIADKLRLRAPVEVRLAPAGYGPMVAGVLRYRLYLPAPFVRRLDREQIEALVAHELAHLSRRDTQWNFLLEAMCGAFFFQPLNFLARRQLRIEAEYLADRRAAHVLSQGVGLARCLVSLAEMVLGEKERPAPLRGVAVGIGEYRSLLGRRVERLLERPSAASGGQGRGWSCALVMTLMAAMILIAAPRALARPDARKTTLKTGAEEMASSSTLNVSLKPLALAAALAAPLGSAPTTLALAEGTSAAAANEGASTFPEGLSGFVGELVGKLVAKDVEKGQFVLDIQRVSHVWKPNKAVKPYSAMGKTLTIEGIAGRWLDTLVLLKEGDTLQVEVKHVSGEMLTFLPEAFKKVEPVATDRSPGEERSETPRPPRTEALPASAPAAEVSGGFPAGFVGFRGMIVGSVVSTDTELGILEIKIDTIKRVWPKNQAKNPASAVGKTFKLTGISGKFLDALLTLKPGDRAEVEAFHVSGESLNFPGEWLKKVE